MAETTVRIATPEAVVAALSPYQQMATALALDAATVPAPLGAAAPGTSTKAAPADHVHPLPTPAQLGAIPVPGTAATPGQILGSDGTTVGWQDPPAALPAVEGASAGDVLTLDTDGTTPVWKLTSAGGGETFDLVFKGDWSGSTVYGKGDVVSWVANTGPTADGSTGLYVSTTQQGGAGMPPYITSGWTLLIKVPAITLAGAGDSSVAIGPGSTATESNGVAVGNTATSENTGGVAVGPNSDAAGMQSVAVGDTAAATGDQGVALGENTTASATGTTATGPGAVADAMNSTAVGASAAAHGPNSTAVGQGASTAAGHAYSGASGPGATSKAPERDVHAARDLQVVRTRKGYDGADPATTDETGVILSSLDGTLHRLVIGNDNTITATTIAS